MPAPYPPLRNLLHLSLDCKSGLSGPPSAVHTNTVLSRFFSDILLASSPPLRSISIRLPDRALSIPEHWLDAVLCTYGGTLRTVSLGQCLVSVEAIAKICDKSTSLERLEVPLPVKELVSWGSVLSLANNQSADCPSSGHILLPRRNPAPYLPSSISVISMRLTHPKLHLARIVSNS